MNWNHKDIFPFSAIVGQKTLKRALLIAAGSPSMGGLLIRGEKGTAKSTAVRGLSALLPPIQKVPGCPFNCDPRAYECLCPHCKAKMSAGLSLPSGKERRAVIDLPLGATEDRLAGSIDLEAAIKEGQRRFLPGLLARAHRGILYIDEVNLLNDHLVDLILDVAASGINRVEREGVSFVHPSRFILVGTMNPEEGELRPQLLDRFGMCVQVSGLSDIDERVRLMKLREDFDRDPGRFLKGYADRQKDLSNKIMGARKLLPLVEISDEMVRRCTELALDAAVAGHRADIFMRKAALAISSLEKRNRVTVEDVNEAAELVLFHRKRSVSPSPQRQEERKSNPRENKSKEDNHTPPDVSPTVKGDDKGRGDDAEQDVDGPISHGTIAKSAHETVFSMGDPFLVKRIETPGDRRIRKGSGRRSRARTATKAGRYIKGIAVEKTRDLAFDATVRAAAPYQKERCHDHVAIAIESRDIREKVREKRIGNFMVFVVDASGSMGAGKRMVAVKGAILSLLLDAYQKRDKVALVAFKGDRAETLLPPTGSIELAHKLLAELPTGGKTPLCHGLTLGYETISAALRKDPHIYPLLVLISDGRANVGRYGGNPFSEALEAAEEISRDPRVRSLVVDVERPGPMSFGLARQLSARMAAHYFKVEDLESETLVQTLREEHLI